MTSGPEHYATTESGRRIYVDLEDERGKRLTITHGNFSPCSRVLWHQVLELIEWDVVLDVGVNYGEMLVGAPIPAGAQVIGFEPNLQIHPYLARTLAENNISIDLRAQALSDRAGSAEFVIDKRWSGMSALRETGIDPSAGKFETTTTPVVTLDEVVGDGRSWCAKIDVEGHEMAVLAGAAASMAQAEHWAILLEILHMDRFRVAEIAAAHPTYLLDRRTEELIRVPAASPDTITVLTESGWLYPQDCVVVSAAVEELIVSRAARVPSSVTA